MGDKVNAKLAVKKAGIPCVPGSEGALPEVPEEIVKTARAVGYPVIIRPRAAAAGVACAWCTPKRRCSTRCR